MFFFLHILHTAQHKVRTFAFKLGFKEIFKNEKRNVLCLSPLHLQFSFVCVDPRFHLVSLSFSLKDFLSYL